MQRGRAASTSLVTRNSRPSLTTNGGSVSSGSPIGSPHASPLNSPYGSPGGSPREPLHCQFANQMSLQPPSSSADPSAKQSTGNTFVHKLFNMVVDIQYQHLIAWTHAGTSFVVCNITEFSRDVLPKHFKHNNFSSFVRQLNMYGFHKVNKSPRGHRALAENQIWEFSHPKFVRGRADLLDEIKRKAMDSDMVRQDNSDLSSHFAVMQGTQNSMMQQLVQLQQNFTEIVRELADTRRRQSQQQEIIKQMAEYLVHHHGAPLQINTDVFDVKPSTDHMPPPIYITSPDIHGATQHLQNTYLHSGHEQSLSPSPPPQSHSQPVQQQTMYNNGSQAIPSRPAFPLTVQTQNLQQMGRFSIAPQNMPNVGISHSVPHSPSQLSPGHMMAINTPLPPSPSPTGYLSEDEATGLYSPHSPHTPNVMNNGGNASITVDAFTMQQQLHNHAMAQSHQSQVLGYQNMQQHHASGSM